MENNGSPFTEYEEHIENIVDEIREKGDSPLGFKLTTVEAMCKIMILNREYAKQALYTAAKRVYENPRNCITDKQCIVLQVIDELP